MPRSTPWLLAAALWSGAFIAASCTDTTAETPAQVAAPAPAVDTLASRQQLFERFFSDRQLLVVYGAADSTRAAAYRQMAQRTPGRWRAEVDVQRAEDVDTLSAGAVMLIGTPETNVHVRRLAGRLPVAFDPGAFSFAGERYEHISDVLTLVFPNPDNPAYPLFLVTGNRDEHIAKQGQGPMRMYDYQVVREGKRIRLGHFAQEPGRRWTIDRARDFDLLRGSEVVAQEGRVRVYADPALFASDGLTRFLSERAVFLDRLAERIGSDEATRPPVSFRLYPSLQQKALVTDDMRLAHAVVPSGEVHIAVQEANGLSGEAHGMEAALVLANVLGAPAHRALEDGMRIAVAGTWHGQDPHVWAGRIARAGLAPTLGDLLDNDRYAAFPPMLREPAAAELALAWMQLEPSWRAQYAEGIPSDRQPAIARALSDRLSEVPASLVPDRRDAPLPDLLKGFNFAHEGFGIVNGYGSRSATEALAYLRSMGANAATIIPYSFLDEANTPRVLPIPTSAGSENDEAVLHAALEARRLGLMVTIKPQIWLRGGWPGDIEMTTEADWTTFFQYYERWIGHYAVMAELYGLDMLCVGTELTKATLPHEDRWRTMTSHWRTLFGGRMVYAPNWGEEFENLTFWDAFDFISVNSYYPLSTEEAPTERDLRKGAEQAVKRMEEVYRRHKKPIVVTEIGFPSTNQPWKSPWLENRESGVNLADQARCYEAVCRALDGKEWFRGIYWWKWPSYLDGGGSDPRGFSPSGKPASEVVARWFKTW